MKNYLILFLILFSGILVAQEDSTKYKVIHHSVKKGQRVDLSGLKQKVVAPGSYDEIELVTINRAYTMAVYPGCEDFAENKRESILCFSEKTKNESMRFLTMKYPEEMVHKKYIAAQVEFIVDKEGKITKVKAKRGDEIFKSEAENAVKSAAQWLVENDTFITPAKMKDGKPVDLIFTIALVLKNPDFSEQ